MCACMELYNSLLEGDGIAENDVNRSREKIEKQNE